MRQAPKDHDELKMTDETTKVTKSMMPLVVEAAKTDELANVVAAEGT
jgi:hypothetical protein